MRPDALTLLDHALGLFLLLILPLGTARAGGVLSETDPADRIRLYLGNSIALCVMALITLAIWALGGRDMAGLGLRGAVAWPPEASLVLGALVVALGADTAWQLRTRAARAVARDRWRRLTPFMPATRAEFRWYLVLAASAGVCEEIMFRGFLIRWLDGVMAWSGPWALVAAVALPAVSFGAAHRYQGWDRAGKIAGLAAAFGVLFVLTGSLLVPVVFHFVMDVAMGWVGFRWMAGPATPTN